MENDICFLCLENCSESYFYLIHLTSKKYKTKFTSLISDLINKEYELRVSDNNKICFRCNVILEKFDELQQETKNVKSILSRQIAKSYNIETSEELVFMDNSKVFIKLNPNADFSETRYSCKMCKFITNHIDSVNSHCLYHKILTDSKIQTNEIIKDLSHATKRNSPIGREMRKIENTKTMQPQHTLIPRTEVITAVSAMDDGDDYLSCQEYDEESLENIIDLKLLEDEMYDSNLKNKKCMMTSCNEEFKFIADYVKHLKTEHKSCTLNHIFAVVRANVKRPKELSKLSCPYCFSKSPTMEMFEQHITHHEEAAKSKLFTDRINEFVVNLINLANYSLHENAEQWSCKYCEQVFNDPKAYNNHLALQHRRCFICFSPCDDKLILRDHILSHTR